MSSIENRALHVTGPLIPGAAKILSEEALELLATFVKKSGACAAEAVDQNAEGAGPDRFGAP